MASRKSDYFVVLGERESRSHGCVEVIRNNNGEGNSSNMQHAKETLFGNELPKHLMQTSLRGIVTTVLLPELFTKTNIIEEPGAVILHAGICGGSAEQSAGLRLLERD